jgi:hypothetical protein
MLTVLAVAASLPLFGALQAQAFDVDPTSEAIAGSSLSAETSSQANLTTQAWYLDMMLEAAGEAVTESVTEMGEQMMEEAMSALLSSTGGAPLFSLRESFTTVTTSGGGEGLGDDTSLMADNHWVIVNRSFNPQTNPAIGTRTWEQGIPQAFGAQNFEIDGQEPVNAFVFVSTASAQLNSQGLGTIDNYLLTPVLDLALGGTLTFWTRTIQGATSLGQTLQVLLGSGESIDVTTFTAQNIFSIAQGQDVGTQIGDLQDPFAYPGAIGGSNWEQFRVTFSPTGGSGRIAFRAFIEDNQTSDADSSGGIGIDTVSFDAVPEPTVGALAPALAALGLVGGLRRLRRRRSLTPGNEI